MIILDIILIKILRIWFLIVLFNGLFRADFVA